WQNLQQHSGPRLRALWGSERGNGRRKKRAASGSRSSAARRVWMKQGEQVNARMRFLTGVLVFYGRGKFKSPVTFIRTQRSEQLAFNEFGYFVRPSERAQVQRPISPLEIIISAMWIASGGFLGSPWKLKRCSISFQVEVPLN